VQFVLYAILTRHIPPAGAKTARNLPKSAQKAPSYRKNSQRSGTHPFLSAHDQINNLFLPPRHQMPATDYRAERTRAFQAWHDVCGIKAAA
jgi:hypothetical protein